MRGLFEVLAHYREIKGIQNALRDRLLAEKPAVFIGVDAPDFNLGLEMQLKQAGIPTVHFISPSIWAWRGGRIKKIERAVSHMLVVFPFEEEIYRKAGVPVTYVGHPLAEMIPLKPDVAAARRVLGSANGRARGHDNAGQPDVRNEVQRCHVHWSGKNSGRARDSSIRFVAPMAGDRQRNYFNELMAKAGLQDVPLQLIDGRSHAAIAAADAVLVASGTATLEVALFKKPMVIAYKMMRASWQIMRHMGYLPWIGLPNILAQRIPRAGVAAGRRDAAGTGRCVMDSTERRGASLSLQAALYRHASHPAARHGEGERASSNASHQCLARMTP